jgi:DDE superfamily endonuclease
MRTLPADLINLIVVFQPLFTKPTWEHAKVLMLGALLARGKRTVTACLRVVGLQDEKHFQNYHRVLNRAQWNSLQASKIIFGLIVMSLPAAGPVVIGGDDTIERRRARKIKGVGCYRDPVASSHKRLVKCFGLKWLSLMMLVRLPWSSRVWALPFLTVLCRAKQEGQRPKIWRPGRRKVRKNPRGEAKARAQKEAALALHKATPRQHKSAIDLLMTLIRIVHRWLPERLIVLVVDGGYAAAKLALVCSGTANLALVFRMRDDVMIYDKPGPPRAGKSGPKPIKGARRLSPAKRAAHPETVWEEIEVNWYGGRKKKMLSYAETALWKTEWEASVEIRYLIARDPDGKLPDGFFATTKLDATPKAILEWVVMRWSMEVTFEEAREHLGIETQRQWSELAIARSTPCLLGLFSLITLFVQRLHSDGKVPVQTAAWYKKMEATFSDCLFLMRKHLWRSIEYSGSSQKSNLVYLPAQDWEHLLLCLSGAA